MSNDELMDTLVRIANVLGRPLDALITDACAMANVELMSRMSNDVVCFGGTQDCEMMDGLPYQKVLQHLATGPVSSAQLLEYIAAEFDAYHTPKASEGRHTYVGIAVRRDGVPVARSLFDHFGVFAQKVYSLIQEHPEIAEKVFELREFAVESSVYSDYIDLSSWVHAAKDLLYAYAPTVLDSLVAQFDELFEAVVIKSIAGRASEGKKGLSLYYPHRWVHYDFRDNDNAWHQLLGKSVQYFREKYGLSEE